MSGAARLAVACLITLASAAELHAQNRAPEVRLVEPERGERRFVAPATIPLEAQARATARRSIVRVEFFAEGVPIGEARSVPYAINWANVPEGEYRLRARATDSQGATDWSPVVRVRVQPNREPRVNLIQPRPNDQFSSPATILLRAQARDRDNNLARVEFYANGTLIGTSTAEPYRFNWGPVMAGEYVVLAKAVDAMGATDDSRAVTIRVTGGHAPIVSLASPAGGTVFSAPGPISVTANATDTDGDLTRVDFYAGDSLIGTALTAPYAITWANNAAGAYALTAQATDRQGFVARSGPVSINVNAPPTVTLTSPISGTVVHSGGSVTLNANAADTDGTINKVDFYRDGNLVGTDTTSPYSFSLSDLSAGTFGFTAVASDNHGGTTASAAVTVIVNAGPTVALGSPASGTVVQAPGSIVLRADAADSDGKVTKVDFFQGSTPLGTTTTAPYTFPISNLASGIYKFTATASDDRGAVTTSSEIVLIVNAAPNVGLTSPAQSAVFTALANIPISAEVADSDGTISRVEFYVGTALIATRTFPPYSIVWTGVPQGTYSVSARAIDNNGGIANSVTASITVNSGVAKLYFVHVDHLNTPRLITDANQQMVWRWDQGEPYGNNPVDENPSGLGAFDFPVRMEGKTYLDKETNLLYNTNRYRDTGIGRFPQADPLGLNGGDLSLYVLTKNNPLSFTDPDGLAAQMCCRVLNQFILGTVGRQRHCYFNVDGTTYGLYRDGNVGVPRINDPRDRGGICKDCKPLPCSDVASCIRDQHDFYPIGDYSAALGPNSNTYAGTIANACCQGGVPSGLGMAPSIGDTPPAHNPNKGKK